MIPVMPLFVSGKHLPHDFFCPLISSR